MPYNQFVKSASVHNAIIAVIFALTSCAKTVTADYKGTIKFTVSTSQESSEIEINCDEKMVRMLDSSTDSIDEVAKNWTPINDVAKKSIDFISSKYKKYHNKNSYSYSLLKKYANGYQSKATEKYTQVCIEPKSARK
jgi:hypothetical protein